MRVPLDGYQYVEESSRCWPHIQVKRRGDAGSTRRSVTPSSRFGRCDGIIENLLHPSLKVIFLKVSTLSLESYIGVGEIAPEMLDE